MASPYGTDISAYLAQLQPNEDDQRKARAFAAMMAGAGLLGTRKGFEGQGIGQAIQQGLLGYNGSLQNFTQQRGQQLAQAAAMQKLGKDIELTNMGMGMLGGGQPQGPQAAPQGQPQGNGVTTYPLQNNIPPQSQPAPSQSTMSGVPSWANPNAEAAFALMGKKDMADVIHRNMQITVGPNGELMRNGMQVGRSVPNGTILYEGGDPSRPKFFAMPADALAAAAQQAGAVKGAETSATEAAQNPYRVQTLKMPDGSERQVTGDQMQAFLRGGPNGLPVAGQSPSPAQQGQDTEVAKGFGNDYLSLVKGEAGAPANIAKYERMKELYSQVATGKLAPTTQTLKSIAAYAFPDLAKSWTADVPYAQAASALSNAMALEMRNPAGGAGMPGALSDADRKYLQSMVSSVESDPRAIPMVLDAKIALEQRNRDIGKLAREYRKQNGRIDEGFYQVTQDYADSHPLFENVAMPGAKQETKAAPQVSDGATGTYNGRKVVFKGGKWQFQ